MKETLRTFRLVGLVLAMTVLLWLAFPRIGFDGSFYIALGFFAGLVVGFLITHLAYQRLLQRKLEDDQS